MSPPVDGVEQCDGPCGCVPEHVPVAGIESARALAGESTAIVSASAIGYKKAVRICHSQMGSPYTATELSASAVEVDTIANADSPAPGGNRP